MVRRFREFDENYNFVGPWMVAKQSRFIDDENTKDQKRFHQSFCSTQQITERIAQKFNERLATIPGVTSATPRIKFLDCHVYVLDDELLGVTGVLVENKLDTKKLRWKKWKNNNGLVAQQRKLSRSKLSNQELSSFANWAEPEETPEAYEPLSKCSARNALV